MTLRVVGDPSWRLFVQDGLLLATGGTDEVWLIDDVPGTVAEELSACWSNRPPPASELSERAALAVAQLRSLGAVRPENPVPNLFTVGVQAIGGEPADLVAALARHRRLVPTAEADVLIYVRTGATLHDYAAAARALVAAGVVHLAVDLAARHTISLGPLSVPGHGACVGCLAARVGGRWGDPPVPDRPGAASGAAAEVAAGLIVHQLELLGQGRFELADRTVSIDLGTLVATSSPCLRTVRCALCAELVTDGRLALPWL